MDYATYHLLGEPETTIDLIIIMQFAKVTDSFEPRKKTPIFGTGTQKFSICSLAEGNGVIYGAGW